MTRRDEAALFSVKVLTDGELVLAAITVCWEVRGLEAIPQEEGVTPFLRPQIRPIDCGRMHFQPGPGICCLSQSACVLDRGPFQCGHQCLLRPPLTSSTNLRPSLPEAGRVVCRPELNLAPECCDAVSCDDTGRRPVLRGRLGGVRKGQSRLFDWHCFNFFAMFMLILL